MYSTQLYPYPLPSSLSPSRHDPKRKAAVGGRKSAREGKKRHQRLRSALRCVSPSIPRAHWSTPTGGWRNEEHSYTVVEYPQNSVGAAVTDRSSVGQCEYFVITMLFVCCAVCVRGGRGWKEGGERAGRTHQLSRAQRLGLGAGLGGSGDRRLGEGEDGVVGVGGRVEVRSEWWREERGGQRNLFLWGPVDFRLGVGLRCPRRALLSSSSSRCRLVLLRGQN